MNGLQKNSFVCKIKDFFAKLCQIRIKSDYNIKIDVFRDGDAQEASSTHSMSGICRCTVIKLAALVAIAWLFVCAMSAVCSCKHK